MNIYIYTHARIYGFFDLSSLLLLQEKKFTTCRPSTSTWHCSVRLSPIEENSPLLPPIGI